jgi:hypothetical protein
MKTIAQIFILGVAVILMTTSCGNNNTDSSGFEIANPSQVRAGALVDQTKSNDLILNFNGKAITISTTDIIGAAQKINAENQDAIDIMNINQTLMGAEKEAQILDVNFTMSDKPVENGMFIFGIETPDAKNLTLEMYDEEGFALVANNKFDINEGNNYKALNVNSLENGTYTFRIKDDTGKELNRTIEVVAAKSE